VGDGKDLLGGSGLPEPLEKKSQNKFTHGDILREASADSSNFVAVLGETDMKNVPWFVYVIMHAQKAKRFKCRTHVGRSKNPFRKEIEHNLKALKRCKVTRPAAGFWKLCMVVGPYSTEHEAEEVVKEWRKSTRAEYGRHANGMKLCENSGGQLLCFSNLVTEDIPIERLKKLPPEYFTPFKSFSVSNDKVSAIIDNGNSVDDLAEAPTTQRKRSTPSSPRKGVKRARSASYPIKGGEP
jgi:hypothetical protein